MGMLNAAKEALFGGANQYPPGPGRPELRAAIARHRLRYDTEYDPDSEILVTAGATEAITASLIALTDPGDLLAGADRQAAYPLSEPAPAKEAR